jgi:uncharacterized protein (TIGR03435 family)
MSISIYQDARMYFSSSWSQWFRWLVSSALGCLAIVSPISISAQAADGAASGNALGYDIVSIKPNPGAATMRLSMQPDSLVGSGVSLKVLIDNAFGIRDSLVFGLPKWSESARYDISAKVVDADPAMLRSLTAEQRRAMLAAVLTSRFNLKIHRETRTLAVFNLETGKHGSIPKPSADAAAKIAALGTGMVISNPGEIVAKGISFSSLASTLDGELDRPVVDKTGLTGTYDLYLRWMPDNDATLNSKDAGADLTLPSLFTAVQEQLGLKMVPARGPVSVLVVDSVQVPTQN